MALAEVLSQPISARADPETGGTLTVDLDVVEANWRALGRYLIALECAAVVKANAYGWDPLESTCRHASLSIL